MSRTERRKTDSRPPQKILLIRLRRAGDVVMTTPAVAILRQAFPESFLSYVVEEPYRRLVEGSPHLNRVMALPPNQGLRGFCRLIRSLRREKYDVVLDFHGGPRASLITLLSGARRKIGYRTKYKSLIYHQRIPRRPHQGLVHSVINHVNLVGALGVPATEIPPLSPPVAGREEAEKIGRIWESEGLAAARVIALHISAGNEFRDWGAKNWAALADNLLNMPGTKVILLGASGDREREKEVLSACAGRPVSLVGRLNLAELAVALRRSAMFVGPDSGPMHLAAASGTPIVALFGPTAPANFAPWAAKAVLVEKDLDCRPCRQRRCVHKNFPCMRDITVDEVMTAVLSAGRP